MRDGWVRSEQVSRLLRVGLGAVWIYEGLLPKLLLPQPVLVSLLADRVPGRVDPVLLLRSTGLLEIALGLALVLGWRLRWTAALHSAGIALLTLGAAIALPHSLTAPGGALAKNAALCAAGVCLWVLAGSGSQSLPARRADLLSLLLRIGLGITWLYAGLVPKWLVPSPAEADIAARSGLLTAPVPGFLHGLGILEAALGLALLAGVWVRELAVIQVAVLCMLTAIVGWTSPSYLADPLGVLSKNLGLIPAALVQYQVGAGRWSLGAWMLRRAWVRRWRAVTGLSRSRLEAMALEQVYAMQGQAAGDPRLREVLARLEREEADLAADLDHLVRRHGGPWVPCRWLAWGLGGAIGFVTVILGTRTSLVFARWAERHGVARADGIAALLPSEDGISLRALQAIQSQGAQHGRLLQEQIRRLDAAGPRGRRR